jgi:TPR repeat protein
MIRIFLLLILLIFNAYANILEDAQEALENKKTTLAIKLYKEAVRQGHDEALFKLGTIYYNKNIDLAFNYFKQASDYGNQKATYNMAIIYSQKKYKFHNYIKSYKIYLELAKNIYDKTKNIHAKAQNKVGMAMLYGLGVDKDYKTAVKWFEESYFKNNYKPAACNLALMYASGKGVFPNFGRAQKLAIDGYNNKIPLCVKVYNDFKLHKYKKDKGFKFGFYK